MNILLINTLYYPYKIGGAEVSVQLLAEGLYNHGHKVRVLSLHESNERKYELINGVEVIYLPLKNIYWPFNERYQNNFKKLLWHMVDNYNPFMARLINKELDYFPAHIVHTNNIQGFSVSIWKEVKKRNITLVHTLRDYYLFHPNTTLCKNGESSSVDSIFIKFTSYTKKLLSKYVDVSIGISNYISKFHTENGFFKNSAHNVIYNPVNKPIFHSIESTFIRIGFIGRLTREKGFDAFCDIVSALSKYKSLRFIAAGRTVALHKINNEVFQKIFFSGFVSLESFLSDVDIVILPLRWQEPFGRVVVECCLANKLVLSTRVGGVSELKDFFPKNLLFLDDLKFENILPIIEKWQSEKHLVNIDHPRLFDSDIHINKTIRAYGDL